MGKFVDPQGISVLVTLVTQDQSVINVPQDIMDSQTAGVSTCIYQKHSSGIQLLMFYICIPIYAVVIN